MWSTLPLSLTSWSVVGERAESAAAVTNRYQSREYRQRAARRELIADLRVLPTSRPSAVSSNDLYREQGSE